jgi:site-specific recombinase XerD
MKRSTFKVLFFLKRDKQKSNGLIPLFCRITVDGQESRFGMKCDVNPKYWDVKTGKATGRTADASQINSLVATTHAAIYRIYREVQERDNYVTAEKIKNIFLGIEQKQQTLLELFDEHNREQALQIGLNVSKPTYAWYCTARKHIAHFLLYKYNLTDIAVKEIKRQFIIDFETFLIVHHHYSQNSVVTILKKFRHIIELALNREWIYKNPFSEYKLRWQKTDRGYLTQSEIESLIHCECEDSRLEQTRDVFIFCCFTGLAYTDIKHLTYGHIQSSVDGNLWLRGKRKKTDIEYNIPLLNIPKTILEKYRGFAENDLVLPVGCLPIYNRHLKELAKLCNINKTITSHLARHTFATLTLTKGVSIESVSKMLGHTNIQTTQIYAKITAKKISNEMNAFAEKINEMGMTSDVSL